MAASLAFDGRLPPPIPGFAPPGPAPDLDVTNLLKILADSAYDPSGEHAAETYSHDGELALVVKRRLKKVFKTIDVDGNGTITFDEFRKLVLQCDSALLGLPTCDLADIFDVADCDGNGEINYDEFLAWLGLGSRKQKNARNVCLEAEKRVGGPTPDSAGSDCWTSLSNADIRAFGALLRKFRPPADFFERLQKAKSDIEGCCLELGTIELELAEKRLRTQGATRRWLADNVGLSRKMYMKHVEEIEKRVTKVQDDQARFEAAMSADPEAREIAQLAGWTMTQRVDRLSLSHHRLLQELQRFQQLAVIVEERTTKDLASKLSDDIFPEDQAVQFMAEDKFPSINMNVLTSLDTLHSEGGSITVSVNVEINEEDTVEERERGKSRWEYSEDEGRLPPGILPRGLKQGVDCLVVIDLSGSMEGELTSLISSLSTLSDIVGREDRISIIKFWNSAALALDWTEMTKEGRGEVKKCVNRLSVGTGTRFSPALNEIVKQLLKLQGMPSSFNYPRQSVVMFLSDGNPEEARDALFSLFSRRMIAFPDTMFAPIALGPEANASLMSELGRCLRGPFYYMPDEVGMVEIMGQLWSMAKTVGLTNAHVVVRPLRGCAIEEVEHECGVSQLGPSWHTEEVSVTMEQLAQSFRSILHFDSEAAADKACKFEGGDGAAVFLAEDVCMPLPNGKKGKGRVIAAKGQRLLHVSRNEFNSKSKALTRGDVKDLEFAAVEDAVADGGLGFDRRPARLVLVPGISTGGIELEFEPTQWSGNGWELAQDVVTSEGTLFAGSRLTGYRLGVCADIETEELNKPSSLPGAGSGHRIYETMKRFSTLAFSQPLVFVFEVPYMSSLVPLGTVQRGGKRQLCVRLRVPRSLEPSTRRRDWGYAKNRQLLDVFVAAKVHLPGGEQTLMQQRVGLTSIQVPWLLSPGQISLTLRALLAGSSDQAFDHAKFEQALIEYFTWHHDDVHAELIDDSDVDCLEIFIRFSHTLDHDRTAAAVRSLDSEEGRQALERQGFTLKGFTVCGREALRRFVAWKFACGLRTAADHLSMDEVEEVRDISVGELAKCLGRPIQDPEAVLQAVHTDAVSVMACNDATVDSRASTWSDFSHRLHGLAAVHSGQWPFMPAAEVLELWETKAAWRELVPLCVFKVYEEFQKRAIVEEQIPDKVVYFEFMGSENDDASFRFRAVNGNGKEVTAYTVRAKDTDTGEVYSQSLRTPAGIEHIGFEENGLYQIQIDGLPAGRMFAAVCYAWNGNRGPTSDPLICSTPVLSLSGARRPGHRGSRTLGPK